MACVTNGGIPFEVAKDIVTLQASHVVGVWLDY